MSTGIFTGYPQLCQVENSLIRCKICKLLTSNGSVQLVRATAFFRTWYGIVSLLAFMSYTRYAYTMNSLSVRSENSWVVNGVPLWCLPHP